MNPTLERPITFTITIVYDNNAFAPELTAKWGFAAVIDDGKQEVLFDTGGDGAVLQDNMDIVGIAPGAIEHVVLSHAHDDHTGGLEALLATGLQPVLHVPPSFSDDFRRRVGAQAVVVETSPGSEVMDGVFVTGELLGKVPEQALVLKTDRGLAVITGCAHPGVDRIVARARELFNREVYLVLGGFHLRSASRQEIGRILRALRQMGVEKLAPCHCTGEMAISAAAEEFGDDFIQAGVGSVIVVGDKPS
jgi:7,8-dihydropterin-6-yl-methyl-4-(beta-D-ribofuranosyl)aminobenzene 5'-phosphate synthase